MSFCIDLFRHTHTHAVHVRHAHGNTNAVCLSDGGVCATDGGVAVADQYIVSGSGCIIIILMTAVFSQLMAFKMNKITPEVSKSSPLL